MGRYLESIEDVYVWKEPPNPSKPGEPVQQLINSIKSIRPDAFVIEPPADVKDPNEMFRLAGEGFKEEFQDLLAQARTARLPAQAIWLDDGPAP